MGLMNMVMGNYDRHWGNWLIDRHHGIKLIDHNVMMPGEAMVDQDPPSYWTVHHEIDPRQDPHKVTLHPAAVEWAKKLNPEDLVLQMQRHGVPHDDIRRATQKLKYLQKLLTKNPQASKMTAYIHPQINLNWEDQ